MTNDQSNPPVNSLSWWENYFENHWEQNSGREQTRKFMEALVANLAEPEREFLAVHDAEILDWGCAFGEGVDVLARAFPRSHAAGLDFAAKAVAEARRSFPRYEFIHTENGQIDREFDVIVNSNCLEYFDNPLEIMQEHLQLCRRFYAVFVPYKEAPFYSYHSSQFREECFPERLLGFSRLYSKVVEVDKSIWAGRLILVVYGSAGYVHERNQLAARLKEKDKWNSYYAALPPPEFSYYSEGFSAELADRISELLPEGAKVMEVGCGGGEQSLALARKGKFDLTLVDFSEQALAYARKVFAMHKLPAKFQQSDAFSSASAKYDLVFNAGVLEHYPPDEQIAFLRSLAGQSRKYVLVLVPNQKCYWYWIWRSQKAGMGLWPYGKEVPLADLSRMFKDAGLHFLGQTYLGSKDTENFIKDIAGLDEDTRSVVLHIHRSGMITDHQSAYLLAALGSVSSEDCEVPHSWTVPEISTDQKICDMTAALSDALACRIGAEAQQRKLEKSLAERSEEISVLEGLLADAEEQSRSLRAELAVITFSRAWQMVLRLREMRARWIPLGSLREQIARLTYRAARKTIRTVRSRPVRRFAFRSLQWAIAHCPSRVSGYFDVQRSIFTRLLPGRVKEFLKRTAQNARPNVPLRQQLEQFISRQATNNPSGRVFLIFSGTTFTESEGQRPTRLARELARRGIPVIFAYWRWDAAAPPQISSLPGIFCLPIDELLKDCETIFKDSRLSSLERVFMMEFPHPSLMEIVNYANAYGWRTVYDAIDDWEEFHKQGQAFWYDRDLETYLLQNADITTITCENMLVKMAAMGTEHVHLLPNAFEDWTTPGRCEPPPARKGRITIGYFGHLTGSWFDWPLLTTVAKRRPDWVFHIIGYGLDKRIAPCNNILFLGKVEHGDLPAYAKNWDVAVIPFQPSKLSVAVDPIKIYEYISLGLPAVVTGMPHLASYPGVIAAQDDLEFEAAVEKAARQRLDAATVEASSTTTAGRTESTHY